MNESKTAEMARKRRAEIAKRFAEGSLPSGQDFEDLVDEMALEYQFVEFREKHEDLLDEMGEIVKLNNEEEALVFKHALGMAGRIGTYKKENVFKATNVLQEEKAGNSFTIVDKKVEDSAFCVEVVAHLEDSSNEMGNASVMLHAIATRAAGRCKIRTCRAPGVGLHSKTAWGTVSLFTSVVALILLAVIYTVGNCPLSSEAIEAGSVWTNFCNVNFAETQLNYLPTKLWELPTAAKGWLLFPISFFLLGVILIETRRRVLYLRWDRNHGLILEAKKVRDSASSVYYHVTRLY